MSSLCYNLKQFWVSSNFFTSKFCSNLVKVQARILVSCDKLILLGGNYTLPLKLISHLQLHPSTMSRYNLFLQTTNFFWVRFDRYLWWKLSTWHMMQIYIFLEIYPLGLITLYSQTAPHLHIHPYNMSHATFNGEMSYLKQIKWQFEAFYIGSRPVAT